ncbi:MAG TPA: 5-dehydro-2-deoxygluconokinase [Alphaproteobacteria bacterium]|nr:5-dehydro-2-deoxygluconokinase [Alphaproteobacteria bacterium]
MAERRLDVVAIGRSSIDLYGEQVGGRLEDMASFAKYVGGCPANISVGCARLGLKSSLVTRVGDEHMGRFIREQLVREGVDTTHVTTDPERLTALVILGIRDQHTFPLIFYRENCADAALDEDDIDEAFIASTRAVLVTGTHFSTPNTDAASRKAMRFARRHGARVVFDIDYRPVLWGLTGHGAGEERFVRSDSVTAHLQTIVPDCDLIVGTEEEIHIAGGTTDTLSAIRRLRELTSAAIVCKRGPMGCVVFTGAIPDNIEKGITGPGFPVEVYNVLGAGDAFMSGFLRGWLHDAPVEECCRYANACGALTVSRHGCAPAMPSWAELQHFLANGSGHRALRRDPELNHLHWATTRDREWPEVVALAFDHRSQFEELASRHGAQAERIGVFKALVLEAARRGGGGETGFGVLLDGRLGRDALETASGSGCWIGRPIEQPGSVPLRFESGPDVGMTLREWPVEHVVKCLVFYHPDDPAALRGEQERQLSILSDACRQTRHELLLEVIPSRTTAPNGYVVAQVLERFYDLGIRPDWWKLQPPSNESGWAAITAVVERRDPFCRGVLLLGLEAPEEELRYALMLASRQPVCRGFAIGRTIFGAAAEDWFSGRLTDRQAVDRMADIYGRLIGYWREHRAPPPTKNQALGRGLRR